MVFPGAFYKRFNEAAGMQECRNAGFGTVIYAPIELIEFLCEWGCWNYSTARIVWQS